MGNSSVRRARPEMRHRLGGRQMTLVRRICQRYSSLLEVVAPAEHLVGSALLERLDLALPDNQHQLRALMVIRSRLPNFSSVHT